MESESSADSAIESYIEFLKPRIRGLMVCLSHSWGGLEQVVAQDVLTLSRLGLSFEALVLKGSPLHEHLMHEGFDRCVVMDRMPRNRFDWGLKKLLDAKVLEGVNLVHTHQTTLVGSLAPWLFTRRKVSLFASRHMMNSHNKRTPFHAALYSRVDALIVMSRALKRNVLETHPLPERRVNIVPLGLDFSRFEPQRMDPSALRSEWGADDQTVVIGLVGRIDPAKGQSILIKASIGLREKLPAGRRVKFVIVGEETLGSTDNHLSELQKLVTQFGLEDQVLFTGYKENIPEVMRALDIFVMPSRQETFGLVAIEAMAMECPIVISSGGSAEEIVGQQEYGLTVRPMDAFDLQRTLRMLIEDPDLRRKLGRNAREYVLKTYGKEQRILATLRLYVKSLRRRLRLK